MLQIRGLPQLPTRMAQEELADELAVARAEAQRWASAGCSVRTANTNAARGLFEV